LTLVSHDREQADPTEPVGNALTIIVPAYNEQEAIAGVIDWIESSLRTADFEFEILVVDDGSEDNTCAVAEQAGARVIRHAGNRGYGEALKTGIRHATHEWIAIIDADGSYPADQIPVLASRLAHAEMVVGARTRVGAAIPLIRRPAKAFLNWLASYLTDTKIPDLNSGLRLFRKSLALEFVHILPSGFSFTTTITMAALNSDYVVEYIPVDYLKRTGSSKIRPIRDTLNFLILILRMTLLFRPLKIYVPLSLMFFGLAGYAWIYGLLVLHRLFDNLIMFLAMCGLMAWMMGTLADLITNSPRRR
jgi:glycosyltransferase involved in cell wall biosynthesis